MKLPGIWTQRDARWQAEVLGNNPGQPWTIYSYGCLITSVAELLWALSGNPAHTPHWANQWLRGLGGFTDGGGNVIWSKLAEGLKAFNVYDQGYSSSLTDVNRYLAPENHYALVWLSKDGFPQHWALMPYVGYIADPWDGKLKPVSSYTFHGAHLYSYDLPQAAVAIPVTPAPVVSSTIQAPQVPVPSTETPVANPQPETAVPAPAQPEWVATYKAWPTPDELIITKDGAYAFDPETGTKLMNLPKGDTRDYAGDFMYQGVRMIRGKAAADAGKWSAVSESYFNENSHYTDGPVQVSYAPTATTTIDPRDPLGLGLPDLDEQTKATFLQKLWEPIAWLFAVLINKKGIK